MQGIAEHVDVHGDLLRPPSRSRRPASTLRLAGTRRPARPVPGLRPAMAPHYTASWSTISRCHHEGPHRAPRPTRWQRSR